MMLNWRRNLAVLALVPALAFGLAACGDEAEDAVTDAVEATTDALDTGGGEIQVDLEEQAGSGVSGTATLTPDGQQTRVVIELENAEGTNPAHIHEGTCSDLNPMPKFPLTDVEGGRSETTVDVPVETLQSVQYAINVHTSATDLQTYLACGDLPTSGSSGTGTTGTTGTDTTGTGGGTTGTTATDGSPTTP